MRPEIVIEYCTAWNYEPRAVGLAEKLLKFKQKIGGLRLVPSGGGAFEVRLGQETLYSKLETGEFPEPEKIVQLVRSKL